MLSREKQRERERDGIPPWYMIRPHSPLSIFLSFLGFGGTHTHIPSMFYKSLGWDFNHEVDHRGQSSLNHQDTRGQR